MFTNVNLKFNADSKILTGRLYIDIHDKLRLNGIKYELSQQLDIFTGIINEVAQRWQENPDVPASVEVMFHRVCLSPVEQYTENSYFEVEAKNISVPNMLHLASSFTQECERILAEIEPYFSTGNFTKIALLADSIDNIIKLDKDFGTTVIASLGVMVDAESGRIPLTYKDASNLAHNLFGVYIQSNIAELYFMKAATNNKFKFSLKD